MTQTPEKSREVNVKIRFIRRSVNPTLHHPGKEQSQWRIAHAIKAAILASFQDAVEEKCTQSK